MVPSPPARRVLYLMSDLGGGTGDHVLSLVKHWDSVRYEAQIVSEAALTSRLSPEVPVEYIRGGGWYDRYPLAQLRRLHRIARHIKKSPPAIVHSYFYWSILYGRALKRLGKVRLLVENREDQGYNWGKREYARLVRSRSLPDRVICVSEAVREVVLEREGLDPERTVVIHNGVEPPNSGAALGRAEVRRELGLREDDLIAGMVSNLNRPIKGVSYFLDAVPHILRSVPQARFVIFGTGREEASLKEKARGLGIDSRVTFAGFRADIERFYPAMDISVLTSLSEGLSISLLQSMNHGLPVVVTSVGGNPEVVVEGRTGYLVPPRDTPAFVEKVVKLLLNPELRTRMGAAGRQRVEESFRLQLAADRYLTLYDDLLSGVGTA